MATSTGKSSLGICSVAGCGKHVSKPGHSLCYTHWKAGSSQEVDSPSSTISATHQPGGNALSLNHLTSTQLGEKLTLSSQKVNQVLAELGWIERAKKGWVPTEQGKKLEAEGREHHMTGIPFVLWPESILSSKILVKSVSELVGHQEPARTSDKSSQSSLESSVGFREKFEATHRALDGHWVRSKAEALIDNWLYMSEKVHAYERQLPVEEELYCDFYIPEGKVYIEYWGLESNPKYQARKQAKLEIYKKYNFNLIELNDEHVKNLDDHLPKMLLKFNVIVR